MNYDEFYRQLFAPLEETLGPSDRETLVAIIGFDAGGPLAFCTTGRGRADACVTYVSCELAVREGQQPADCGRYELLCSCDDEQWVRSIVSDIGRMSLEVTFGDGHTLDIGPWVEDDAAIQGVVFETACTAIIGGSPFGVLRVIGIARPELEYAQEAGSEALLKCLGNCGVYPDTKIGRRSVV